MIRRLRRKLVAFTTAMLTVVLALVLCFTNFSTRSSLRGTSMSALQAAESELSDPGTPGRPNLTTSPCFILELGPHNGLVAVSTERYDLSDRDMLLAILEEAMDTGLEQGVLKDRQLRFLRLSGPGKKYAFMDISAELATLKKLDITCAVIAAVALIGIFCISMLLARWAVRPVEQAWDQQRQFVADASHELKTPLTVILTNAELLASPEYDDNKEQLSASILTMSRQMRGLVEELLDQARVDNGNAAAEHSPLDMSKLVSDAVLPFEPMYFESGRILECQIQPGITLRGSQAHLRRVVEILLDNGCKYATPGGTVLLRLTRQGRNSLLSITSPGQTMTEQQCVDIFKRFYRVDAARSMNHSYGLGLSIAQGIVQQHGGRIWAQSQDGWNTFFVELPG